MSTATLTESDSRRQVRAPRGHGTSLVQPPFAGVGDLLSHSSSQQFGESSSRGHANHPIFGDEFQSDARRQLIQLATDFTSAYRVVSESVADGPILMSGHQPTLFHPGVWFKNVALSHLTREYLGVGVHLIVDNDVVSTPGIDVPIDRAGQISRQMVPLDAAQSMRPYEEWDIQDRACFDAVAAKISNYMDPFVANPLIQKLWPLAKSAADRCHNLGQALSQARHQLEASWGIQTLELPVSQMADTDSFRKFFAWIIQSADSFREIYNREVQSYRTLHRIRSSAHPVPLLTIDEDWCEVPFWVWTQSAPARQPLFVSTATGSLRIRLGSPQVEGKEYTCPTGETNLCDWLSNLRDNGLKVRPRALTMTMYARLVLCDLFLHGIGGSKYDELGDSICGSFFGCAPPPFMTLSATLLLPTGTSQVEQDDVRQVDGQLRDLWFHPERHLDLQATNCPTEARQLAREKQQLVDSPPSGARHEWHRKIVAIDEQLRAFVHPTRQILLEERDSLQSQLQSDSVLRSREWSFSLFPETRLKRDLLDLCPPSR